MSKKADEIDRLHREIDVLKNRIYIIEKHIKPGKSIFNVIRDSVMNLFYTPVVTEDLDESGSDGYREVISDEDRVWDVWGDRGGGV